MKKNKLQFLTIALLLLSSICYSQTLELDETEIEEVVTDNGSSIDNILSNNVANCVEYFKDNNQINWSTYKMMVKYTTCYDGKSGWNAKRESSHAKMYISDKFILLRRSESPRVIKISKKLIKKLRKRKRR